MSLRFAVVYEHTDDLTTASELADRELVESIDWLDESHLEYHRCWLGDSGGVLLKWKNIKTLAAEQRIRAHGHFDGEAGESDAQAARRAILYLRKVLPELNAIVLVRDQDDQAERRKGLEQARAEHHGGIPIVVGLAVVERECWVLSGFDPVTEGEAVRLADERQTLGFQPHVQSHELTACKDDAAKRSPKRVLKVLCGDDRDRERRCWLETPLQVLRERGQHNGLSAYLEEVRTKLVPLIGHAPSAQ